DGPPMTPPTHPSAPRAARPDGMEFASFPVHAGSTSGVRQRETGMTPQATPELDGAYRRIFQRLVPFLMLLWVLAWIDRVNIGFIKLTMLDDLKWSEAVYGFGAGIFFLGYFFFEVPSNLLLQKIGARKTIMRITI